MPLAGNRLAAWSMNTFSLNDTSNRARLYKYQNLLHRHQMQSPIPANDVFMHGQIMCDRCILLDGATCHQNQYSRRVTLTHENDRHVAIYEKR